MDWVNNVLAIKCPPAFFSTDYELKGRWTVAVNHQDCSGTEICRAMLDAVTGGTDTGSTRFLAADVPSACRDTPMRRKFSHYKAGSNIGTPCMPWMVRFLKLFTKLLNFFPDAVTRAALRGLDQTSRT
jgi:hypothetical protein